MSALHLISKKAPKTCKIISVTPQDILIVPLPMCEKRGDESVVLWKVIWGEQIISLCVCCWFLKSEFNCRSNVPSLWIHARRAGETQTPLSHREKEVFIPTKKSQLTSWSSMGKKAAEAAAAAVFLGIKCCPEGSLIYIKLLCNPTHHTPAHHYIHNSEKKL